MSTLKNSGWLAAVQTVVFSGTQTMSALTDNEWTDLSDVIDNSSTKWPLAALDLTLGSAAFTGTDAGIEVFIVQSVDDTNYGEWTSNTTVEAPENMHYFATFLPIKASTAARRIVTSSDDFIVLPQAKFKFGIRNRGNVTLAASGNALTFRPHSNDSV